MQKIDLTDAYIGKRIIRSNHIVLCVYSVCLIHIFCLSSQFRRDLMIILIEIGNAFVSIIPKMVVSNYREFSAQIKEEMKNLCHLSFPPISWRKLSFCPRNKNLKIALKYWAVSSSTRVTEAFLSS